MDTNMTFRMDADVKSQMAAICKELGMTTSTAFNLFANAFVRAKGMPFPVTVRNVIDFGAFVDIGVHQDGLVHISQISSKFIRHPSEAVAVGDVVKVVVLEVDEKKHRISLSIKQVKE